MVLRQLFAVIDWRSEHLLLINLSFELRIHWSLHSLSLRLRAPEHQAFDTIHLDGDYLLHHLHWFCEILY